MTLSVSTGYFLGKPVRDLGTADLRSNISTLSAPRMSSRISYQRLRGVVPSLSLKRSRCIATLRQTKLSSKGWPSQQQVVQRFFASLSKCTVYIQVCCSRGPPAQIITCVQDSKLRMLGRPLGDHWVVRQCTPAWSCGKDTSLSQKTVAQGVFVGCTLHMCSDACVWVTSWHGEVLCAVCENRRVRHATHHLLPCGSSTQLDFLSLVPSRLCACVIATDHPPGVGLSMSVGCCCSHRAGIVDHSGSYP